MRRLDVLREWRERWNQPEVKPIARQLAAEMLAGEVRTPAPFGLTDARVDLRGLQVDLLSSTHNPMYERPSAHHGHWVDLDLSGSGLSGMNWMGLRVTNCVFADAQLDDLRCWGVEIADCSAQRASLRHAQIGAPAKGFARSSWRRVDLRGADLRQLHGNVVMEDVDLSRAKFGRTSLGWSGLNRVQFEGVVKGLSIGDLRADQRPRAWTLQGVDFTEARPHDLSFIAVNLGSPEVDIRLPDDESHWLIRDWPQFLDRVDANAPNDLRATARTWTDHQRINLGPQQTWGFTTLKDALTYHGEPFAELLRASR